jgi:hypothetical protein
MPIGTGEVFLYEKIGDEKSCDTVPVKVMSSRN